MGNINLVERDWQEAEEFVAQGLGSPGDLIMFEHGHWAMYEGDGKVIHVSAQSTDATQSTVTRQNLVDLANKVAGKTKVKVDNLRSKAEKCATDYPYKP
jgi:mevalonate kinase